MATTPLLERRRMQRVPLRGRVSGHYCDHRPGNIVGISENVSAEGMFVFVESQVPAGARVELVLELPSQEAFTQVVRLRCVGRVVRAEWSPDGQPGIAVAFDEAEITP